MRERDIASARLTEGEKDKYLWDDRVRGLALRVRQKSKSFVLKMRIDGQIRWLVIGRWGEITLKEARSVAKRKLGAIALGNDSTADRKPRLRVFSQLIAPSS